MKTEHKRHSGGESCSCTTCVYKSESDHPSLRRFIGQGSRIDRLYYGKYIPLRERKLLERLVRTRAVYDDIRAQLLSDSTVSLSTKGDIKPRKKRSNKELDDKEKSDGAILQLVSMVDKGAELGSTKLSDCCSCCSCSSNVQIHEHVHKKQMHKRAYAGAYVHHTQERIKEAYKRKKGVRFKAKHISSDPCTCTFKFSGLIKKHSKAFFKKMHPEPPLIDLQPTTDEEIKHKGHRIKDIARSSYENLKQSNTRIREKISEGVTKLRESQTRLQEKLELQTKKSIEKLSQAKNKLTTKIKTSVQKIKAKKVKPELLCLCPEKEIAFQVKKDSISKFKDDLMRKKIMKDWECEPECTKDTCVPEECFIRLKQKKSKQKQNLQHKGITYNIQTQEKKAGESLGRSSYKIQAQKLAIAKTTETQKVKPNLRAEYLTEIKGSHVSFSKDTKKKKRPIVRYKPNICGCEASTERRKANKANAPLPPLAIAIANGGKGVDKNNNQKKISVTTAPEKKNVNQANAKHPLKKNKLLKSSLEKQSKQHQVVRIGSSFSFNIEFYKKKSDPNISTINLRTRTDSNQGSGINYSHKKPQKIKKIKKRPVRHRSSQIVLKKSLKDTQTKAHALKRCFCTLKLKAKATKTKIKRPLAKKVITTEKSTLTLNSSEQPCSFDCTPDDNCEIKECKRSLKLINVQTSTDYKPSNGVKIAKRKKGKKMRKKFNLLPYECEPGVCVPGDCDPYQCIKLINLREGIRKKRSSSCACPNLTMSRKTKSTSSFTSRSYKPPKAKYVQSMVTPKSGQSKSKSTTERTHIKRRNTIRKPQRQAVRIGSTFSFNIEFYKRAPHIQNSTELKSLSIKPKQKTYQKVKRKHSDLEKKERHSRKKNMTTQIYKKERNALIGTKFERCFCTLKLQKKKILKIHSKKTITMGTETVESSYLQVPMANKSTKTKLKYPRSLDPFECEPFTCIPGACDPYMCLERINKRNVRLKEVGLITNRPETTSSSTYSGKPHKAVQVQYKPIFKEQKMLVKTQKPNKHTENTSVSEYPSSLKSRQAVKIGSSFSFDIEFYKNKSPAKEIKYIFPKEKAIKTNTSKKLKNKGVEINKLNIAHVDTQIQGQKKHDKSSVVGPLLKRCFCTLNLQKKRKHQYSKKDTIPMGRPWPNSPLIYTVNRAMVGVTPTNTNNKYMTKLNQLMSLDTNSNHNSFYGKSKNHQLNHLNKRTCRKNDIRNKITCEQNLVGLNCKVIEVKRWNPEKVKSDNYDNAENINTLNSNEFPAKVKRLEKFIEETIDTRNINRYFSSKSNIHYNHLTGLSHYSRRCFCTMNLKIENKEISNVHGMRNSTNKKPFSHKLKPYECEPGICVPGECNPYECEKLISKRIMKRYSKKSGTAYSSQSISSSTKLILPKMKANKKKINTEVLKATKPYAYKKSPRNDHKKIVRIGSSFSFDMGFYKTSSSQNNVALPKYSSDTNLSKPVNKASLSEGTQINSSQSQSVIAKARHKGSLTKSQMKRCFCTLKLQKKGKIHTHFKNKQPIVATNEIIKVKTTNRGQNTKKFKPLKIAQSLRPYECEPNICVPGECDPYQCLEIMKKRNYKLKTEIGTSPLLQATKSISSMTDKPLKKIHKRRAVFVKPKKVTSKSKTFKHIPEYGYTTPPRQAVRIGSSFSFNIEFYKDQASPASSNSVKTESKIHNVVKLNELPKPKSHTEAIDTEHNKKFRHKRSQIKGFNQPVSTLTTSFVKRCFCTAKLYKSKDNKDIKKPEKRRKTFLQNCLCLLKKVKQPVKIRANENGKYIKTEDKKINTNTIKGKAKLDPYECEPGICVPGECDPYLCEKIMRKNANVKHFKASTAEKVRTRSVSSNNPKTAQKNVNTRTIRKEKIVSINNKPNISHRSSDKNIVRIGSKFSFDIEFSKNQSFAMNDIKQYKEIDKYNAKLESQNKNKVKVDMPKKKINTSSHSSQVKNIKVKNNATGINNLLKRCFCTLKLYENERKFGNNGKNKEVKKKIDLNFKDVKSKSVMTEKKRIGHSKALKSFECEPNVCIPYQCNPYECEKLIKLRHNKSNHREFGVLTTRPKKNSIGSIAAISKSPKGKNHPVIDRKMRQQPQQNTSKYSNKSDLISQSKQIVKLGSSISFNIEFYKNDNWSRFELEKHPKKDQHNKYPIKNQSKEKKKVKVPQFNQKQIAKQVTKTQSTMTGTSPLKRCFCTLSLKKTAHNIRPKVIKTSVSTETDKYKIKQPMLTLLPYECEPNFCVPGKCNPATCYERIKKRHDYKHSGTSTDYSQKRNAAVAVVQKNSVKTKKAQLKYYKRPIKSTSNLNPSYQKEIFQKDLLKQAVRIGSNFSFDIEFYKENKTPVDKQRDQSVKKRKHIYDGDGNIELRNLVNKDQRSHGSQGDYTKKENKSIEAENILKRCFCTLRLQNKSRFKNEHDDYMNKQKKKIDKGVKNTKEVSPFLKRCFCVLKLNKIGKQKNHKASVKFKTGKTQTISKNKNHNRYRGRILEPFECEPNVCVPGYCDPYQCEKRIKKRLLRENFTEPVKPSNVSTFSTTNDIKLKPVKLQTAKTKSLERRHGSKTIFVQKTNTDVKRQVVRIGSNISFDIEFFKNNIPYNHNVPDKQDFKNINNINLQKKKDSKTNAKKNKKMKYHNRALQPINIKKDSAINPFIKRCFCTLKLQKMQRAKNPKPSDNIIKHKVPAKSTENKNVATKKINIKMQKLSPFECEPNFCIPGECNPYECAKRIKMRERKNITTQVWKEHKSVGVKPENWKSQRNQTNIVHTQGMINDKPHIEKPGIVEIPRFANIFNKQAVRVGSNFSFNIEFYKQSIPETADKQKNLILKKQKDIPDGGQYIKMANLQNRGSQGDNTNLKNKSIEVENRLKRCFCTLKLQNKSKLKNESRKLQPVIKNVQFPQTYEVRRVAVQHKPKMLPKQTFIEVKSVATKIDKKHLKNNTRLNTACNSYICKNGKTITSNDMKTILPYMPKKFNKTVSKTVLPVEKIILDNKSKPRKTTITNYGKRLTRKVSRKHLNDFQQNTVPEKQKLGFFNLKSLFNRCVKIFNKPTSHTKYDAQCIEKCYQHKEILSQSCQNRRHLDGIKSSKSERQARPNQLILNSQMKKSKSLKLRNENDTKKCKKTCPFYLNYGNNLLYQGGDTKQKYPVMSFNINKKEIKSIKGLNINKKETSKFTQPQKFVHFERNPKLFTEQRLIRNRNDNILCTHCLMKVREYQKQSSNKGKICPLKYNFFGNIIPKNNFQTDKIKPNANFTNYSNKPHKNTTERVNQSFKCCYKCGRKIDKIEVHKAAGDQVLNDKNVKQNISPEKSKKKKKIDHVCSGEEAKRPLFEMHLDSGSYELLNRDEVVDNVEKLNQKNKKKRFKDKKYVSKVHDKSCRCCICLAKNKKVTQPKKPELSGKPCVCGSLVCAKRVQRMIKPPDKLRQRYRWKRCVCGSPVCAKETVKMKNLSDKLICICKEEEKKRKKKEIAHRSKIEESQRNIRLKAQKKEDKVRNKKRRKEHKRVEKLINKQSSDVVLLAESAIDIGKLGITACTDVLRTVARYAIDPKHAYKTLVNLKDNPQLLAKHLKDAYQDSGIAATTRRVRLRCLAMRGVKRVKRVLESYAITKYILYIASKDPKKRQLKPQRVRERYDFGCSLYMGSLRKRPFLSVYDRCPWFYPHFLSLLNVWRQFMDMTLFLLAVVVWSPCIIGMELCRACMCCFFCTG